MGNATSLFNLTRNIGGSIGIAVSQTLLARAQQVHINILGAHVNPYSAESRLMFESLRHAFIAAGSDASTATQRAYATLFGMVRQQAAMLSFNDVFRLLGFIFILVTPLVLLMRRPRSKAAPASAE